MMQTDEKFEPRELALSLVVGAVAAISAAYLTLKVDTWAAIFSAILWFYFGFFSTEYIQHLGWRQKREKENFLKQMEACIDSRMKNIMEYAAIYTENNKFENVIQSLRTASEKKMWIIAKFISKKLSNDFSSLEIKVNAESYSDFVSNLYPECKDSIYLTCPFTPEKWFKQLHLSEEMVNHIETLNPEDLPPHVKALTDSPAMDKKRHVILGPEEWEDMCKKEKLVYIKKFLQVNKGVQIRFTPENDLKRKLGIALETNKLDYMIFDKELMLLWEKPQDPNQKTTLGLHTEIPNRQQILDIFDYKKYGFFRTGEDIIKEVSSKDFHDIEV